MWSPGTLLLIRPGGLKLFRPFFRRVENPLTCIVLGMQNLSFGTKGAACRYVVVCDGQIFTADVNYDAAYRYFDELVITQ